MIMYYRFLDSNFTMTLVCSLSILFQVQNVKNKTKKLKKKPNCDKHFVKFELHMFYAREEKHTVY